MKLFCTAIIRDSVSLIRFSFHRHIHVFLGEISTICCFKYPYSYFSFHFCFFLIIILLFESFSHQLLQLVFYWSLSNSKSSQVSRTLLSILADHNNALFWMVMILPLISNSSSLFSEVLGDYSKCTDYNYYYCHPNVPLHFCFSGKV